MHIDGLFLVRLENGGFPEIEMCLGKPGSVFHSTLSLRTISFLVKYFSSDSVFFFFCPAN